MFVSNKKRSQMKFDYGPSKSVDLFLIFNFHFLLHSVADIPKQING